MSDDPSYKRNIISYSFFFILSLSIIYICYLGSDFGKICSLQLLSFKKLPGSAFILLFSLLWGSCLAFIVLLPKNFKTHHKKLFILVLALILRSVLFSGYYSDDVNRYLWEGKLIANNINPYLHSPDSDSLKELRELDPYHKNINHKTISAAYPPLALLIFSLLSYIGYSPFVIKGGIVLFDLGVVIVLFSLLKTRSLCVRWSILYAFNPIVLYSFASHGHYDSILLFFICLAIYFYDQKKWKFMFSVLSFAFLTKYIGVLLLLFFVNKKNWKKIWIFFPVTFLFYMPFLSHGVSPLFKSVRQFAENYAFNGSIHAIFRNITGSLSTATNICSLLFLLAFFFGLLFFHPERNKLFKNDPIPGCFFTIGSLLLLSPTVHFWYISWIIPFLVITPNFSWIILCLTSSFYFVTIAVYNSTGSWSIPSWALFLEWVPFYIFLIRDIYVFNLRRKFFCENQYSKSFSAIIPVKNEENSISSCIKAIKEDCSDVEILVIDGGSTDDTRKIAENAGAKVILHDSPLHEGGGRGGQIYKGLLHCTNDIITIVHADTIVPPGIFSKITEVFKKNPRIIGGAVGSLFAGKDFRLRLLEIANDFRMAFLGIAFGDQIQFFRKSPVLKHHAFPNIPLMEDVELSLRLKKMGSQIFLFEDSYVSSRRWDKSGYKRSFLVIKLVTLYLFKRLFTKSPDTQSMYKKYYSN